MIRFTLLKLILFAGISPILHGQSIAEESLPALHPGSEILSEHPLAQSNLDSIPSTLEAKSRKATARENYYNSLESRLYVEKSGDLYPVEGVAFVGNQLVELNQYNNVRIGGLPGESVDFNKRGSAPFYMDGTRAHTVPMLLPGPRRADELFYSRVNTGRGETDKSRLGDGRSLSKLAVRQSIFGDQAPDVRLTVTPAFGAFYDTSTPGSTYNVSTLPLDRGPEDGQTSFFSSSQEFVDNPIVIAGDAQIGSGTGIEKAQLLYEVENIRETSELKATHLFARILAKENFTLLAGKTASMFQTQGYNVPSLNSQSNGLIGSGKFSNAQNNTLQLRLQSTTKTEWGTRQWGLGVEEPFEGDSLLPGVTELTRWPTVAVNYVLNGQSDDDRLQLAAIMRNLGGELGTGEEQFETGWGISAYGSKALVDDSCLSRRVTFGVAGGDAIGQYINGVSNSVVFNPATTSLVSLEGFGTFIGLGQDWFQNERQTMSANFAVGYASMETPAFLSADTNRILKQLFGNIMYYPRENVAIGCEYQYGRRESNTAGVGENHRFLAVLSFTTRASASKNYKRLVNNKRYNLYHRDIMPTAAGGTVSDHKL